jgi:D-alanyl-D-alanine carboxypeptidase
MTNRLRLTVVLVPLACTCFSQTINKAKLDSFFTSLDNHQKFMGSVAIAKNGRLEYTKAVGYSDMGKKKADETTRYRIGSITKTFTATLVLKAVENNKLKLDDTIDKYFPGIANAKNITIRHLLSHRSGIHNFTNDSSYQGWFRNPKTRDEMIAVITKAGSDFEPGSKASYSNSAYVLLTFILEDLYNQPYAKLLENQITKPLGLKSTYMGGRIEPATGEARSYRFTGAWTEEPETHASIPQGAGAIVSTPADLAMFADALFNGKLVSDKSLQEMKILKDRYGLGLISFPFYDKTSYGHAGAIDGFTSVLSYDPDNKVAYAMISNGTNYNNNNVSIAVLSAAYDKPYEIPSFSTYKVSSEDLDIYLGEYASTEVPIKITIVKQGNVLMGRVNDQPLRPLDASALHKFKDESAGVVIEFNPAEKTFIFKQGGREVRFKRN